MATNDKETDFQVSLVQNDRFFLLQRRIGLIPEEGLGLARRAVFFSMLAWLPIVIWAFYSQRALPGVVKEPLLQHFGIHMRFLVAVPILIFGEGVLHNLTRYLIPYFRTSGLIAEAQIEPFRQVISGVLRLRNSTLPWVVIITVIASWIFFKHTHQEVHELVWANIGQSDHVKVGFGGWWLVFVARPIFAVFLCVWLWRLVLLFVLCKRIASLKLEIVPTHPDGAGGLGFLERMPLVFSPFCFAVSAVLASSLAHDVVYHGVHVQSLFVMVAAFLIILVIICLSPLMVFIPTLARAKRLALFEYGALIGKHGRLVRKRWILKEPVSDDPILDAPEIGPVADALSIYDAVDNMRATPISKTAVLGILLPAIIPLIFLFAIEIPIKQILLKIITTLV